MMIFDALVAAYARRSGHRALATILAIALAVTVVLSLRLVGAFALATFGAQTGMFADEADFSIVRPGSRLDREVLERVRAVSGIASATPRIDGAVVAGDRVLEIQAFDLLAPLPRAFEFRSRTPGPFDPDGSGPPTLDLLARDGAFVSPAFATQHRLHVGDRLAVAVAARQANLLVSAILPRDATAVDANVAIVDVETAARLFETHGTFDRIACTAYAGDVERARRGVATILPAGATIVTAGDRRRAVERAFAGFGADVAALGALTLLIGALLTYDAIAISVLERRHEIGTLRALGTSRRAVARAFVIEGLVVGSLGALLGVGGGTVFASLAGAAPAGDLYAFDRPAPLVAFAVGVALATIAALLPARDAAAVRPVIALGRPDVERRPASGVAACALVSCVVVGCIAIALLDAANAPLLGPLAIAAFVAGAACGIPPLLAVASALARAGNRGLSPAAALGFANLASARRRVATTIATFAIGVAVATAVTIVAASFRTSLAAYAARELAGDLVAMPFSRVRPNDDAGYTPQTVARVAALPEVARVIATRTIEATYRGAVVRVRSDGSYARSVTAEPLATIDSAFALLSGTHVGDAFHLAIGGASRRFRVAAIASGTPFDAGSIELDDGTFAHALGDARADTLAIAAKPQADLERLRARILKTLGSERTSVRTTRSLREGMLANVDGIAERTFVLAALGATIAALGIAVALGSLVLERRDQIRLVRYAGLSRSGVRAMVLYEAAALGALGGIAGLALGTAIAYALLAIDRTFGWDVRPVVPALLPVASIGGSIAVAALAALAPARDAARLPVGAVTQMLAALLVGAMAVSLVATPCAAASLVSDGRSSREVWRALGHLRADDGTHVDVAATFFRYAVGPPADGIDVDAASLSILREESRTLRTASRVERGASARSANVRLNRDVDGWHLSESDAERGEARSFRLRAADAALSLDVRLRVHGAMVPLGPNGMVRTGTCATCVVNDVAYPRLDATGTLADSAYRTHLTGAFWLERESGGVRLGTRDRGWQRFTIAFDDGRSLVARVVRDAAGRTTIVNGTFVSRGGFITYLDTSEIDLTNPMGTTWRNSRGTPYPSLFLIGVARFDLDCAVVPELQNQETNATHGARYYQGSVDVERANPGPRDRGRGYVELTGYDAPVRF